MINIFFAIGEIVELFTEASNRGGNLIWPAGGFPQTCRANLTQSLNFGVGYLENNSIVLNTCGSRGLRINGDLTLLRKYFCDLFLNMSSIFSNIIAGHIPSYKIYEDQWTFAILAKDAIHLGHTLIVPKVEVDYFIDVPEPYYLKVFENARFISRAIQNVTSCKRVGTVIAGWDIPHFHYHLVPMFDYHDLDPKLAQERSHEENLGMQGKLLDEIKGLLV